MKRVSESLEGPGPKKPRPLEEMTRRDSTFERVILPILPYFVSFLRVREILRTLALLSKQLQKALGCSAQNLIVPDYMEALHPSSPYIRVRRIYPRLITNRLYANIRGSGDFVRSFFLLGHPEVHLVISVPGGLTKELAGFIEAGKTESKAVSIRVESFDQSSVSLRDLSFPKLQTLVIRAHCAYEFFSRAENLESLKFFTGPDMGRFSDVECRKTIRDLEVTMVPFDRAAEYAVKWSMTHFPRLESLALIGEVPFPFLTGTMKNVVLLVGEGSLDFGLNQEVRAERLEVYFMTISAARKGLCWPFRVKSALIHCEGRDVLVGSTDGSFSRGFLGDAIRRFLSERGLEL